MQANKKFIRVVQYQFQSIIDIQLEYVQKNLSLLEPILWEVPRSTCLVGGLTQTPMFFSFEIVVCLHLPLCSSKQHKIMTLFKNNPCLKDQCFISHFIQDHQKQKQSTGDCVDLLVNSINRSTSPHASISSGANLCGSYKSVK